MLKYPLIMISFLAACTTSAAAERPNVILMMTDDQGIGDFGVHGNQVIETPNFDALAKRSGTMSTFYVSPVCSPTRACLMTGRYNYRTRCIDTWLGRSMMDTEEVTIAELLSDAGYATGIFGKWHLGDCYPMRPNDQGFGESLVHRGGGLAQPSEPLENQRRYTNPILFHNGRQVQTKGFCTDVYYDAAIKFIAKQHRAKKNFFVYLPTNAPHGPYHDVPEDLREHYMKTDLESLMINRPKGAKLAGEKDRLARIAAMITNVDQNVGRLFAKLDELQITDNTIVVHLNDNGPNTMRYVGNRRGMKSFVHEGGIRSPLWMQWPKKIKAGTTREELAAHIDLLPTILDACDVSIPTDVKLDGKSFLPLLTEPKASAKERFIVMQSHRGDEPQRYHHFMIRSGNWKLVHPSGFGRERFSGQPNFELYNLASDPQETTNLVERETAVFARLKASYDRWFDDVSSTRKDNYAVPRIHVATPHENPTVLTRQDWRGGSWSARANGHWELLVAKKATFDVEVVFAPGTNAPEPGAATLQFGATTATTRLPANAAGCKFKDVEVAAAKAQLKVDVNVPGNAPGVYQIILHAK